MKKLLAVASLFILTQNVNAQSKAEVKKLTVSVGPVVSLPTGDFGKVYNLGIGAEAQASLGIASGIEGFAQAGYSSFSVKSSLGSGSTGFIPALIGARYINNGLSFGAGLGYGSFTGNGSSDGGFAYSPQVGYNFSKIQATLHYTSVSIEGTSFGMFGLKAFYNF